MARKQMTSEEYAARVAEVEAHRDDPEYWDFAHPSRIPPFPRRSHVPVTISVPGDVYRAILGKATREGTSVVALLEAAACAIAAEEQTAEGTGAGS